MPAAWRWRAQEKPTDRSGLGTLTRHLGRSLGAGNPWVILSRGSASSLSRWLGGGTRENVREGPGQRQVPSQQVLAPGLACGTPAPPDPAAAVLCARPLSSWPSPSTRRPCEVGPVGGHLTVGHGCWNTLSSFMHCMWLSGFSLRQVTCAQPYPLLSSSGSHGSTRRDGGRREGSMWRACMGPAGGASHSTPCA